MKKTASIAVLGLAIMFSSFIGEKRSGNTKSIERITSVQDGSRRW